MTALNIQEFSEGRTKARAYFCYMLSKNLPNRLPEISEDMVIPRLLKIKADLEKCEGVYLLDHRGIQISSTFAADRRIDEDKGKIRTERAYYYRAVKEARCTLTDPYPSLLTHELTVTASMPIYCIEGNLKYVACIDMQLEEVIKISHLNRIDTLFAKFFKFSYAMFAFALTMVSIILFIRGVESFFITELTSESFQVKDMFEATILLTLSLAIFDLVKTLVEEEIMGRIKDHNTTGPHKTMVRFLGSIIIALSIEALMLVFKFAITDPDKLMYAMSIVAGVSVLLIGLAVYIKFTKLQIED